MTIKLSCDNCGADDIGRSYTGQRLRTKIGIIQTETIVAINNVWNGGHLCYGCLIAHLKFAISDGENSDAQLSDYRPSRPEVPVSVPAVPEEKEREPCLCCGCVTDACQCDCCCDSAPLPAVPGQPGADEDGFGGDAPKPYLGPSLVVPAVPVARVTYCWQCRRNVANPHTHAAAPSPGPGDLAVRESPSGKRDALLPSLNKEDGDA